VQFFFLGEGKKRRSTKKSRRVAREEGWKEENPGATARAVDENPPGFFFF
jgi:hypothetical protein